MVNYEFIYLYVYCVIYCFSVEDHGCFIFCAKLGWYWCDLHVIFPIIAWKVFYLSFAANYCVWAWCIYILIVNRLRISVMRVRFSVEWLFPIKFYVNCGSWSLILVHRLQGFLDMICSCRLFLLVCVRFCSRRFCSPIFRKLMSKSCVWSLLNSLITKILRSFLLACRGFCDFTSMYFIKKFVKLN